jgi:hypothetical protein
MLKELQEKLIRLHIKQMISSWHHITKHQSPKIYLICQAIAIQIAQDPQFAVEYNQVLYQNKVFKLKIKNEDTMNLKIYPI